MMGQAGQEGAGVKSSLLNSFSVTYKVSVSLSGDNNSTNLIKLLWALNKIMNLKGLSQGT